MKPPFRWTSCNGQRHGVSMELVAGDGTALCGESVVVPKESLTELPVRQRCAPTCVRCDTEWRRLLGYRPRPGSTGK